MQQTKTARAITRLERLRAVRGFAELSRRSGTAIGHFSRILSGQRSLTSRMQDIILSDKSTRVLTEKIHEAGYTKAEAKDIARLKTPETFANRLQDKGISLQPKQTRTRIHADGHNEAAATLKRLKGVRGLSEAARTLGLSRSSLSAYMTGRRRITDRAAEKILSAKVSVSLARKIEKKGFTPFEADRLTGATTAGLKRAIKVREKMLEEKRAIYKTTMVEERKATVELLNLVGRRRLNEFEGYIKEQSKRHGKSMNIQRRIMRNWVQKAGDASFIAKKMAEYRRRRGK